MKDRFVSVVDGFLPSGVSEPERITELRAAIVQCWLGIFLTATFGLLYAFMGSPLSGASILFVMVGLALGPSLIQRGFPVHWLAHLLIGGTWLSTFLVTWRSGGFSSPALVWNFMLPLSIYAVAGKRSAFLWSGLATLSIAFYFVARLLDVSFPQDFGPTALAILQIVGYVGVVLATMAVFLVLDGVRTTAVELGRKAERALDRQQILDDMHDGVGSQILGLLVRSRTATLTPQELTVDLEACLEDLRLIVDSLDPEDPSLHVALGAVRARIDAKSAALHIETEWDVDSNHLESLRPTELLQMIRALQEMVTNAQRHARTPRLSVRVLRTPEGKTRLSVRDYGIGLPHGPTRRKGRGLKSLEKRARRLGGKLEIEPKTPGTDVSVEF